MQTYQNIIKYIIGFIIVLIFSPSLLIWAILDYVGEEEITKDFIKKAFKIK